MHRLLAGVTILEHELSALRLLVERQTGILLDCPNSALAAHIADYLERTELESPAALLARFRSAELAADAGSQGERRACYAAHLERGMRQRRRTLLHCNDSL